MRIYSNKTYLIWPTGDTVADVKENHRLPSMVTGKQLREKIKNAEIKSGDTIYELTFFAQVKEKRSVELIDDAGDPVDSTEETNTGAAA